MNAHHLELFYYVARYRGISNAVRRLPYVLQQPAVSEHMASLERDRGAPLFERKPFCLTPAGADLYDWIRPTFQWMELLTKKLAPGSPVLRVAASQLVLTAHLPDFFTLLQRRCPQLRLQLISDSEPAMLEMLVHGETDLVIAPPGPVSLGGLGSQSLLRLSLALLAHASRQITDAGHFWAQPKIKEGLIVPGKSTRVIAAFEQGLHRLGATWQPAIAANALLDVTELVRRDCGIGLTLDVPQLVEHRGLRVLPLEGFPSLEIAAFWREPGTELIKILVQALQLRATRLAKETKPPRDRATAT